MDNINADLATLKEKEQEILDKNAQIESLNSDKEKLNVKVAQAENEARKWNSSFQKKSIELEQTKQEYESTIARIKEEAQNAINALNAQIEKITNDYEDEIEGYQGTIERLDNVNKALQTSLNNEKATNAELIAKNVSLEQELKAKDDEIVELENKLEEANNQKKEYIDKGNEYWEYAGDYLLKAIRRGYQPTNYEIEFYKISEELEKLKQNDLVTEDGGSDGSSRSRQR